MSALDQLAAHCGIQDSAKDAFGKERTTTPELKRSLLEAMRLKVDEDGQAKASLESLEAREWDRPLPPVVVTHRPNGHEPVSVPIVLAEDAGSVRWSLTLEDGGTLSGEANASDLSIAESITRDGRQLQRRTLNLTGEIPFGYHKLSLEGAEASCTVIVSPGTCWLPPEAEQRRLWGVAANLYLLRSQQNWGIGDFTDLRTLIDVLKPHQADCLGLNPLHAMFLDKPEDASPYSPSDRLLLNVLNIDVQSIPEFPACQKAIELFSTNDFQHKLQQARDSEMVNYGLVADLKLSLLPIVFEAFEQNPSQARHEAFEAFHSERRELLDRACLFQAMRDYFSRQDPALSDSSKWPEEYRSFRSPAVARWAQENASLVRYHLWLQWIADEQLKAAAEACKDMAVGLYRDLAVGAHPTGAEVWSHPDALISSAHVGAPPDILNRAGQNWGLPPMNPLAVREQAYASFTELLRANMRYAGALRIDHAMALLRLYWIPEGNDAKDGAYVHYPLEDLIGIVALESQRAHCMVIAEALGTVPEGFTERLTQAKILSYLVLNFEIKEDVFVPPAEYPYLGLSVASNHDLATLNGWWRETDIDLREAVGLFPDGSQNARDERARNRESLVDALKKEDLIPQSVKTADDLDVEDYAEAATRFLARTNCLLTLVQSDDILGSLDQVNLPGTTDQHPNWRRKLPVTLNQFEKDPKVASQLETTVRLVREERKIATERQIEEPARH